MRTLAIYSDILGDQGKETKVSEENKEIRDRVARMSDKQKFTKEHYLDFFKLWADPHIKKTLEYKNQFQLIDTSEYLFSNMGEYYKDEYIPTFEDLIHSRQRTTGVNKIKFVLPDKHGAYEEIYGILYFCIYTMILILIIQKYSMLEDRRTRGENGCISLIIRLRSYLLPHCLDIISYYGKITEIIECVKQ